LKRHHARRAPPKLKAAAAEAPAPKATRRSGKKSATG
jgi:hypothetical protein